MPPASSADPSKEEGCGLCPCPNAQRHPHWMKVWEGHAASNRNSNARQLSEKAMLPKSK